MSDTIRTLIIGANGMVGRQCIQFGVERGLEIVGAVGHSRNIGEDVGELAGVGPLGVVLEKDLKAVLERTSPDIVIDASVKSFADAAEHARVVLSCGIDMICLSEEVYYGKAADEAVSAELDAIAKEQGASLVGLGIQDVNWSALAVALSGNCQRIDRIVGENWCIVDYFGEFVLEDTGAGMTPDAWHEKYAAGEPCRNAYTFTLYEIADELGLEVIEEVNEIEPRIAHDDYHADMLDFDIKGGEVIGSVKTSTLKTREGIDIVGVFGASFGEEGVEATNSWSIYGEPDIDVVTRDMRGDVTTAYDVVNRVPDVVNARPGFLLIQDMPKYSYKAKSLPEYVK